AEDAGCRDWFCNHGRYLLVVLVECDPGNASPGTPMLYFRFAESSQRLAGALNRDFDPAILCPSLRRIVRGDRPCVAKALGRNAGGGDALGYQIIHHVGSPPR